MAKLRLHPPDGPPHEIGDGAPPRVFGRGSQADVLCEDGSVSRKHARIEARGGGEFYVVDLGAANGTFFNGQQITEARLVDGGTLGLGSYALRVEIDERTADEAETLSQGQDDVDDADSTVEIGALTDSTPTSPSDSPPPARAVSGAPPPPANVTAAPRSGGASPIGQTAVPPLPARRRGPAFWTGMGCLGCLGAVLLFFGSIGGMVYYFAMGPAREPLDRYVEALEAGDLDAAYGEMSEAYRRRLSRSGFAEFVASHPGLARHDDLDVHSVSVDDDGARIGAILEATSGETENVEFVLARDDDGWRIDDLRFSIADDP